MRHFFLVMQIVVMAIAASALAQGPLPDLDTLMDDIREAAARREQFLTNAQGYCEVVTQVGSPYREDIPRPNASPPNEDYIDWTLPSTHAQRWYRKGNLRRTDTNFLRKSWRAEPEKRNSLLFRVVDIDDGKGYLTTSWGYPYRIHDVPRNFDVHALFHYAVVEPVAHLEGQLRLGRQPTLTWSLVGETPCIMLAFAPDEPNAGEASSQTWSEFHFSPSQDYALLRATAVRKYPVRGSNTPFFSLYHIAARYAPTSEASGTWMASRIEMNTQEFRRFPEALYRLGRLHANLRYEAPNEQLTDTLFDFEGLGLPANAPLIDLRTGLSIAEGTSGLVIAPEGEYLFTGIPTPIPVETAYGIEIDLGTALQDQTQQHIHSAVRDRIEAPTPHAALYRRLALGRLHSAPGDTSSLLDYALRARDAVLVRALVEPYAPGFNHRAKEPSEAAMELVEETIRAAPENLSPLHVEALHLAIDIRKPRKYRTAGTIPAGYNRAITLLCECLAHVSPAVQAAALKYLPGRDVRTQTAFEAIKAALRAFVERDETDADNARAAAEKLVLLSGFASVHPAGLPDFLQR